MSSVVRANGHSHARVGHIFFSVLWHAGLVARCTLGPLTLADHYGAAIWGAPNSAFMGRAAAYATFRLGTAGGGWSIFLLYSLGASSARVELVFWRSPKHTISHRDQCGRFSTAQESAAGVA